MGSKEVEKYIKEGNILKERDKLLKENIEIRIRIGEEHIKRYRQIKKELYTTLK